MATRENVQRSGDGCADGAPIVQSIQEHFGASMWRLDREWTGDNTRARQKLNIFKTTSLKCKTSPKPSRTYHPRQTAVRQHQMGNRPRSLRKIRRQGPERARRQDPDAPIIIRLSASRSHLTPSQVDAVPAKLNAYSSRPGTKNPSMGRGSGKHGVARALILAAYRNRCACYALARCRIPSWNQSKKLLSDQISDLEPVAFYEIQKTTIKGANGSQFYL